MSISKNHAQSATQQTEHLPRFLRLGLNLALVALWLWLYRAVFDYLAIIFSREDFRTNQIVLVAVVALIVVQARKEHRRPQLDAPPRLSVPALALALGASALYLAAERFLDVNTLSASLFGLASYGLLGLWLAPQRWRQGLAAVLLLIGTLPFGEHMQTFIGYPMRILTAAVVRDGLAATGVASIGIDTILVFENGVSQVDLPCSGVKSLWTGMLFLIALSWIERRRLNVHWLLTALVFVLMLFIANLSRVGMLVAIGHIAGWPMLAEMLHIPLGVLGFIATCAAAAALLRLQRPRTPGETWMSHDGQSLDRPVWLAPVLAAIVLVLGLVYTSRPQTGLAQAPPVWDFPPELVTEPMPFKPDEAEWLMRDGAEWADRRRFAWRGITGSMILISSTTWRAQHRPERCFEVYGLSLDDTYTYLVTPDFPVRFVSLGVDDRHNIVSASYWFQSAVRTTDDYATRIWADLPPHRSRWVLVSILFDGVYTPHTADMRAFYNALHAAVAGSLQSY